MAVVNRPQPHEPSSCHHRELVEHSLPISCLSAITTTDGRELTNWQVQMTI